MRLNRRVENWQQTLGDIYLFNGALLLALAPFGRDWRDLGFAAFSIWLGLGCWRAGCQRAAQNQ